MGYQRNFKMVVSVEDARVPDAQPNLEVLVGTYEEFNLGFRLQRNVEGVSNFHFSSLWLFDIFEFCRA